MSIHFEDFPEGHCDNVLDKLIETVPFSRHAAVCRYIEHRLRGEQERHMAKSEAQAAKLTHEELQAAAAVIHSEFERWLWRRDWDRS